MTIFLSALLHLLTFPAGLTPIHLDPRVISPLSFHLTNTNGYGFPEEYAVLHTSCSPLLGDFMIDKGQSPTLTFLNKVKTL